MEEREDDYMSVRLFLNLPQRIQEAEEEAKDLRKAFYQYHSFIGSAVIIRDDETSQRVYPVEKAALDLIDIEGMYTIRINRLKAKWEPFQQHFTLEEMERARQGDTEVLDRMAQYIEEYEAEREQKLHEAKRQRGELMRSKLNELRELERLEREKNQADLRR